MRLAEELSDRIKDYDERIEKLGREKYGQTEWLRQVKGVGPLTSLAYVLTLENPDRFRKSRDVVVPRTLKGGAVLEMEVGPLRSAYRGGSQTAGCC